MKFMKLFLVVLFVSSLDMTLYASEKTDCSKIKNNTLVGNIKSFMCKRGTDKLDEDGNFKKGFWKKNKKSK